MRITQVQLKHIIREELERSMDEMAWGGHIGIADDFGDEGAWGNPDYAYGEVAGRNEAPGSKSRSIKYAQGPKWAETAMRLYENLPFTLWTAPYIGTGKSGFGRGDLDRLGIRPSIFDEVNTRVRVLPLESNLPGLESMGYDISKISPTDVVILYTTASVQKDIIPSPWMLFHAIFDNADPSIGNGSAELRQLVPSWSKCVGAAGGLEKWMTMGSARSKSIGTSADASAEAMTQELLDRRGFHLAPLNTRGKSTPAWADRVISLFKEAGDEFRTNAPGHLITVVVT